MQHGRRRFLGRALLGIAWLYATATSLYVLILTLEQPAFWNEAPQGLRVLGVLFGVGITALNVTWVALLVRELVRGEGSQYLLSRTAEGTARISLRAIQTSLHRRMKEMEDVLGGKLAVRRPASNRLRVEISYTTTEDRNAIVVSEKLRRNLRQRFDEIVHVEEDFEVEFDVKIDGFVPGGGTPEEKGKSEEEEPFTGPRYPID